MWAEQADGKIVIDGDACRWSRVWRNHDWDCFGEFTSGPVV